MRRSDPEAALHSWLIPANEYGTGPADRCSLWVLYLRQPSPVPYFSSLLRYTNMRLLTSFHRCDCASDCSYTCSCVEGEVTLRENFCGPTV